MNKIEFTDKMEPSVSIIRKITAGCIFRWQVKQG